MLNTSKRLLFCCVLACCMTSARADDAGESKPTVVCCGREAEESRPVVGREPAPQSGSVNSDLSNCVCLKYIYAYWGDGTCGYYATDCFGSPFSWTDVCDLPHPQDCDVDSCGTCITFVGMPTPQAGGRFDARMSDLADHTIVPKLYANSGTSFFEEPFFVRIELPDAEKTVAAKVFPILAPRRELRGHVLPAQVFYQGIEVRDLPSGATARPVHGEALGGYACRVLDHGRVLQVRTHTLLTE